MDSRKQKQQQQQSPTPMEIDPIDDGPAPPTSPPTPAVGSHNTSPAALLTPIVLTKEEEAKQAIEALRADDMAQRVTAAHRLPAIAAVLGPERTRTVRRQERVHQYYRACTDSL